MRPFIKVRNKDNPLQEDTLWFEAWSPQDWVDFATYTDFKSWAVKGPEGEGGRTGSPRKAIRRRDRARRSGPTIFIWPRGG